VSKAPAAEAVAAVESASTAEAVSAPAETVSAPAEAVSSSAKPASTKPPKCPSINGREQTQHQQPVDD
jgi:hypothetical protein